MAAHLHRYPELAFRERCTAEFIASKLESFDIEVHRGCGGTGVVGCLRAGSSQRSVGLRADMDALPLPEISKREYASKAHGIMHACGHDGHMAMLLGAAKVLARSKCFDGTVYFVFQPAEEQGGGAVAMIRDGLFRRFPMEAIYGLHNMPGMPAGNFAMAVGTNMAAADSFDIIVQGSGTHAAFPHLGNDCILASAAIIIALQCIVSREVNPAESALGLIRK